MPTRPDRPITPRAPNYGSLGRITDEATQTTIRQQVDRIADLERRLGILEASAVQTGSPASAHGERITNLADPQDPFDAVNLRTLQKALRQVGTGAASSSSGGGGGGGGSSTLTVLGRGFALNGIRHDWRGITSFTLLWQMLNAVDITATLDFCEDNRVHPRILLSFDQESFWRARGYQLNPATYANYWPTMTQLFDRLAARSLTPEIVIFGDCSLVFTTQAERLTYCRQVAQWIKERNAPVYVEIANEPYATGISNADCYALAQAYAEVDPTRILAAGVMTDPNNLLFNREPLRYVPYHSWRELTPTPFEWVMLHWEYAVVRQQDRPAVDNEPINAGTAGTQVDPGTDRWYAYGFLSRILQFSTTFHFNEGIFGAPPNDVDLSLQCFEAWRDGLNVMGFDTGGTLFQRDAGGSVGDNPFSALNGAAFIAGRHDGASGQALIIDAPSGWTPTLAAGWTATIADSRGACRRVLVQRV